MGSRLRDMQININDQQTEPDKDLIDILIGPLRVDELLALLNGDIAVFDQRHHEIQTDVENYIQQLGGDQKAKEVFFKNAKEVLTDGLKDNPCVYPGFEPEEVCKDIVDKHYDGIIACIRRSNYSPEDRFSTVASSHTGTHLKTQALRW